MRKALLALLTFSLIGVGGLAQPGRAMLFQTYALKLQVDPLQQSQSTSCGEAVITMAYNYANPKIPLDESTVIDYAAGQGYYTSGHPPFTSPADMANIVQHYTINYSTGNVVNANQGLMLLFQKLQNDEPVMIDVLARLGDLQSGAHFILVTGLSIDPAQAYAVTVYYNDPLTGENKASPWAGSDGIWNAWQQNSDPGGSGWWLAISSLP